MSQYDEQLRQERIYRLTVRTLYLVALALNALVIYEQVKSTPEASLFKARAVIVKDRVVSKLTENQRFRRAANRTIYEATTIVEEARYD